MARALSDHAQFPDHCMFPNVVEVWSTFGVGTSGAVDNTKTGSDVARGMTLTNTGTGTFDGTFPACMQAHITPSLKSAAATVTEVILTAISPTAGTFSIRCSKAGTATNPASGDLIQVRIAGKTTAVQA